MNNDANKNEIALENDGEIRIMSRIYPIIPLSNGLIFRWIFVSPAGCGNNSHTWWCIAHGPVGR